MDANGLTPEETVPASCKLGRDEALALASEVKTIIAAKGKRVTTHWAFVEQLRERGEITVLEGPRFVRDGNLVTSAGVSAGIDMALWLVGQLKDPAFAREVQKYMEYNPAPPYAAEI